MGLNLNPIRNQVLQIFKQLHRTRQVVFSGDTRALELGRVQINTEFKSKKGVSNPESIQELLNLAINVEKELKASVVQLEEVKPQVYRMKLRPETHKLKNSDYKNIPEDQLPKRNKKCKK